MYQKKESNIHGVGRKGHFKPEMVDQVYRLALLGATDKQIAEFFKVSVKTIDVWKQNKPEFIDALRMGKLEADARVSKSLFERAIGYSHPDTVVLQDKEKEYDAKGRLLRDISKPRIVEIVKHYPPDSWACMKWLSLRQREIWADTQNININNSVTGSVDLKLLSEQLKDIDKYSTDDLRKALKIGIEEAAKNNTITQN